MGRIKALDPDVVHKIAAGEIIVSPVNALKELIENSIDAGATSIDVVVKDGGHKLLQISDNGSGIDESDLPVLCQRFTTSKISDFRDLEKVATLGFRGEALASISHIAHLSVKTKTVDSATAVQATYEAGVLQGTKRSAGVQGTQITVEDLFYNVPMRLKALQSSAFKSAEYQKIVDVVSKYAIQYPGTFSCKRHQDSQPMVIHAAAPKEKIKKVYGLATYQELIEVNVPAYPELGLAGVQGYVTGLNYTTKRSTPFVFFINKRLVSCEPLARAVRKIYQSFMPQGSANSFVFLSIDIDSKNVDVNVHPTKREVHFLNEVEIINEICGRLETLFSQSGESRDFRVQSYITSTALPSGDSRSVLMSGGSPGSSVPVVVGGTKPRYEYNLVRTDPRQQTLTSFAHSPKAFRSSGATQLTQGAEGTGEEDDDEEEVEEEDAGATEGDAEKDAEAELACGPSNSQEQIRPRESDSRAGSASTARKSLRDARLESIQDLLHDVKLRLSPKLFQLFSEHTFVGVVDANRGLAAVQHDVRLYLVEYHDVAKELFYQIGLTQFANFGTLRLGNGLALSQLLQLISAESLSIDSIVEMAAMLEEYFQIVLDERSDGWYIVQLPVMLPGYTPPISRLPQFIADLATKVDWEHERECLHGIIESLASLHVPTAKASTKEIELIFESVKLNLVPSRFQQSCVVEIANLPGLYRVFERC